MVKRLFFLAALSLSIAAPAQAGPDFYGVKMKSEDFAQDLMVRENNLIPDFTNDRPGMDRRVYAYGYASTIFGRGRGVSIRVFNHSEETISTERLFRECAVVLKDGRRYDRSEAEMQWRRDALKPGEEATFNMIFKGVDLRLEDIRMIVLSFGLGRTNIFLFPTRAFGEPTEPPARLAEPKAYDAADPVALPEVSGPPSIPAAATAAPSSAPGDAVAPASAENVTPEKKPVRKGPVCVTPVSMVQSMFSGLGNAVGSIGRIRPPSRPAPKSKDSALPAQTPVQPEQVFEDARYHFAPEHKDKVAKAEEQVKKTVFVDRPWSMEKPGKALMRTGADYPLPIAAPPRIMAEVVQVDVRHGFIVFNAGTLDGVKQERVVSVLRNGRRIGKAMVRKVRDKVSAAGILPEWQTKTAIQAGDQVELS